MPAPFKCSRCERTAVGVFNSERLCREHFDAAMLGQFPKCVRCNSVVDCMARGYCTFDRPPSAPVTRSKRDRIDRLRTRAIAGSSVDQLRAVVLGILDLLGDEL